MERFLTAFVLGLCAAPLFFVLTLKSIDRLSSYLAPGQGPNLSSGIYSAIGMVVFSFLLVGGVSFYWAGHGYLRPVQSAAGLMLAGWSVAGAVFAWHEPRQLDYNGQEGLLEVEIRVVKSLLESRPLAEAVVPSFLGGGFDYSHTERIRQDGDFLILPWETTVTRVHKWTIWISLLNYKRAYFPLNLPYRPTQSTNWSAWEPAMPHKGTTVPLLAGITIRYRFLLVPQRANK